MSTAIPIDPDASTALLKERIKGLFRQVPKGLAGDEEAVHQMRVAGRRLRVALPLLARKPGGKRVQRALEVLQQLTRTAGGSRDLDVIYGLLSEELAAAGAPGVEARRLRQRLLASRRRSRSRMAESLMDLEIARLRRDLRAVVHRGGQDMFSALSLLYQERDRWGADLIQAVAAVGETFDPEALHDLRKRARRLRYAAEVAGELRAGAAAGSAIFRDLQGELGTIHDAHVLAGWLAAQAQRARPNEQALAAEARRLEQVFQQRALGAHRKLLDEGVAETVARALAAMGGTRSAA